MNRVRGLTVTLGALILLLGIVLLLNLSATQAQAAPQPGEIFIDGDGDRTWDGGVLDTGLFATIQDGINAAAPDDVVVVGPGNYSETLSISVNIKLVGANEGINPNTGVRVNETCLMPNAIAFGPLVLLGSSNVTIDGFCLSGSNPSLPALGTINGVNLTMAFGLQNFGGESDLTFVNNIMTTFDTPISLAGGSHHNLISANQFDNIMPVIGFGQGIQLVSDYYANITSNVFTRTYQAMYLTSFAGTGSAIIDGNTMSVYWDGIVLDRIRGTSGVWNVSNNAIDAIGLADTGIWVQGVEGSSAGVGLYFNAISGMRYGVMLVDNPTTVGVKVIGGLLINCDHGIYAQEGSVAFVSGDSLYTVDSTLIVNPTSYAAYILNTNSLGPALTRVSFQNMNIVLGGSNGVGVEGTGAVLSFNGVDPIEFLGITDQYIRLISSPRDIDARQVMFDGLTGADMTPTQLANVEAKLWHFVDDPSLGIIMIVSASVTVTKYNDTLGDGLTLDDVPIQGWTVYLWRNGVRGGPQLTSLDGTFTWADLGPGDYKVSELVPADWTATSATEHDFGRALSGSSFSFDFTNFKNVNVTATKLTDRTGDGQTLDDTPLPGWTVYLWTNGVQGSPAQTLADGTFTWANLGPGSYKVSELVPAHWTATSATEHDFGTAVSGVNVGFTFTNFQNVNITATKLNDITENGPTADDTPIQGWTVYLWTNGVQGSAELTKADGTFTWADLGPGSYRVSELVPAGWVATSATDHDFGTAVSGVNGSFTFTNFKTGNVSGDKFFDFDLDGVRDVPTEPGLSGWTIYLNGTDFSGNPVKLSTTTDPNGHYQFTGLDAGTYRVAEGLMAGWFQTGPAPPGTYSVQIVSGSNFTGVDFGNVRLGKVEGYKFFDYNLDGSRGASDPGLGGWTISISGNGVSRTTNTASNGYYAFSALRPGVYLVTETLKSGWTNTTSLSYQVTVGPGTPDAGDVQRVDFGNVRLAKIDGYKFFDRDMNGKWGWLEPGLKGVTIQLWTSVGGAPGAILRTTVTDGAGHYSFTGLRPGTYFVSEVIPSGWINTTSLPIKVVPGPGTPSYADVKSCVNIGNSIVGPPGYTVGFWKNNIQKNLDSNGRGAQVSKFELKLYLFAITKKYYAPLNSMDKATFSWLKLTSTGSPLGVTDKELRNAYNILNVPDSASMQQKAKAQILALLLTEQIRNLQSWGNGYSDAFVYIPASITDSNAYMGKMKGAIQVILADYKSGNYATAKDMADYLNNLPSTKYWP